MGKNYLASCLNTIRYTKIVFYTGVMTPPPRHPLRQRFQRVMTVRYDYQTRKQQEEKGHSARLITKEPVNGIMLASLYLNCCDLQCKTCLRG